MTRWVVRLSALVAIGWLIRRILGLLAAQNIPTSTDALLTTGEFIKVGELRIHYEKSGTGMPVVCIHGLLGNSANWAALNNLISDVATTYAIDLPGSGLSDKPATQTYDAYEQADILIKFVDSVVEGPVRLITASVGVQVALVAMKQRPELFTDLIALAPVLEFPGGHIAETTAHIMGTLTDVVLRSSRLVSFFLKLASGPKSEITARQLATVMTPTRTPGFRTSLSKSFSNRSSFSRESFCPPNDQSAIFIVVGLADCFPTTDAHWLHNQTDGELHMLPGCGHFPEIERAEDVANLVRALLKSDQG